MTESSDAARSNVMTFRFSNNASGGTVKLFIGQSELVINGLEKLCTEAVEIVINKLGEHND